MLYLSLYQVSRWQTQDIFVSQWQGCTRGRVLLGCQNSQLLRTYVASWSISAADALYDADDRWLSKAFPPWYFTDGAVSSGLVLLTQNHIVHLVIAFIRAGTLQSAAALTLMSTSACVSELLEQPVNATFRPFFVRKFFPQLSRIISFQLIEFLQLVRIARTAASNAERCNSQRDSVCPSVSHFLVSCLDV